MPFQIIRNDITKVKADAIVNTANPLPIIGGGTDSAIYEAAGKEKLLKEREKTGEIKPGNAVLTPAFNLNARYIIHTVGPVWEGGNSGEYEILHSCYRNSLNLALENNCESIAFPLISSGVYGFPKDKALSIAIAEIGSFLLKNEMNIYLVVFDKKAYELSGKIFSDVKSFVDEHYVNESHKEEYGASRADVRERRLYRDRNNYRDIFLTADNNHNLTDLINKQEDSFRDRLFKLIDRSGMDDVTVYKKANVSRKVFSDIRKKPDYKPAKKTALGFAIALELSMADTIDLLSRAGIALSKSNKFDLIVGYFISQGNYDLYEINMALYDNGEEGIGVIE